MKFPHQNNFIMSGDITPLIWTESEHLQSTYICTWSNVAFTEHGEYINQLIQEFETTLKGMIEMGIEQKLLNAVTDPISLECIDHLQFAKMKAVGFQGRQQFLDMVKEMLHLEEDTRYHYKLYSIYIAR